MTTLEAAYKSLKVLVIEDEAEVRRLLCRMLERLGVASVLEAEDGASGFDAMLGARPDIVLCDIHMAPVDGQEFLKRVRASETDWVHALPVVFLSGDHNLDTVRLATQRQVDGYMVKPVTLDAMKKQLDIVITRLTERGTRTGPAKH